MDGITKYILQIAAAAILCTIVKTMLPDSHTIGKFLRIASGVFLIVTVLSPVFELRLDRYSDLISDYSLQADSITAEGQTMANEAMTAIIKENTETYILSEAKRLDLDISVEVMTDQSNPPVPCEVIIKGNISPYGKKELEAYITQQIGIPEENMQWIRVK